MVKKKIKEIAELIKGELIGDGDIEISGIKDIFEAGEGDLTFILHPKFSSFLDNVKASCAVVPPQVEKAKCPIIRSKNPSLAFRKIVDFLMVGQIPHPKGVHKSAIIGKNVSLGKDVGIGAYAVIEDGVKIGDNTVIYPFTYVGHSSTIGDDCLIYSHVSIREKIEIGSRVIIHSSSVIGSDGFGFDSSTGRHLKIPQIGNVTIGDDVEIGASVTVDRAKFAHTKIGKGTKIDNLVQIAHNVEIGENCLIVAQAGIAGSSILGKYVVLGGQAGVVDHTKIGDNVMIGSQSGVTKSVQPNTVIWGSPARQYHKKRKVFALSDKLPDFYKRLKKIEKALNIEKE